MKRKGLSSTVKMSAIVLIGLLVVGLLTGAAVMFMQGSIAGDGDNQDPADDQSDQSTDAPWAQRSVKVDIEGKNLSSETLNQRSGSHHHFED